MTEQFYTKSLNYILMIKTKHSIVKVNKYKEYNKNKQHDIELDLVW